MLLRALFLPLLPLAGTGFGAKRALCACVCVLSVLRCCFAAQSCALLVTKVRAALPLASAACLKQMLV